jgi:hypothetical protein
VEGDERGLFGVKVYLASCQKTAELGVGWVPHFIYYPNFFRLRMWRMLREVCLV